MKRIATVTLLGSVLVMGAVAASAASSARLE